MLNQARITNLLVHISLVVNRHVDLNSLKACPSFIQASLPTCMFRDGFRKDGHAITL